MARSGWRGRVHELRWCGNGSRIWALNSLWTGDLGEDPLRGCRTAGRLPVLVKTVKGFVLS